MSSDGFVAHPHSHMIPSTAARQTGFAWKVTENIFRPIAEFRSLPALVFPKIDWDRASFEPSIICGL